MAGSPLAYNISSNGAAGDWYWEVIFHGEIMARGLASTEATARVDAKAAANDCLDRMGFGQLFSGKQLAAQTLALAG